MQTRPDQTFADATRLLPGPHTAEECAAMEAALVASSKQSSSNGVRWTVGVAALAVAVTIPDLSLGAMGSPSMRIDLGQPRLELPQILSIPAASSTGPVYAPAMAAEQIAPASLTVSTRSRQTDFEREMPLGFLAAGSERFDLAFAGVELPSPVSFTVSAGLPEQQPLGAVGVSSSVLRTRSVDIEQIANRPLVAPAAAPSNVRSAVRRSVPALTAGSSVTSSVAATNASFEAAFAGPIDVSGGVREALPVERARIAAIPTPDPALTSSRAIETELVPKTQLNARVNGVLTGSVEFEQRAGTIAIRLGSVVDMLRDRFSARELAAFQSGQALNSYVTLAELQAAGIPISYNPAYDEVEFGIDYQDAPDAGKVQIEQIGAPTVTSDAAMIDQIPR